MADEQGTGENKPEGGGGSASGARGDGSTPGRSPIVFVSDASAEAERITGTLRTAGYVVVDVAMAPEPGSLRTFASSSRTPSASTSIRTTFGRCAETRDESSDIATSTTTYPAVRSVPVMRSASADASLTKTIGERPGRQLVRHGATSRNRVSPAAKAEVTC